MRVRVFVVSAVILLSWAQAFAADESEYRVGPKDLIEIKVFQVAELNLERRVAENGTIDLPLLGPISVGGMTTSEIQDRLEAILTAKYVNRADVFVVVKEYANKPILILGAVGHPSNLGGGKWSLAQAITASGGLTEAAGKKIRVFRRADNGLSDTLYITTDELNRSSDPKWDIPIVPGDTITVPARSTVTVYCLGEIKTQGPVAVDSDEPISLLKVIVRAGGLTDRASHTLHIQRKDANEHVVEMKVNYSRILSGKDPDVTLQPDDIVMVKESIF
jgi:polysaccharide export outer membrane protein